jgi:hypothetical protein
MKTTNKSPKTNAPQSLANIDTYLYALDSNGPETAGVYQSELNILISHYKEAVKVFRLNKEKTALALAKARLTYWTELQSNSEQKDWCQVQIRGWAQHGKERRKKAE